MLSNYQKWTGFLVRTNAAIFFAAHLTVSGMYWWLSPKGFPLDHSRFWLNAILPLIIVAVASIGIFGLSRERPRLVAIVLLAFSAGWLGGALAGRLLFPVSLGRFWGLGAIGAIYGFGLFRIAKRTISISLAQTVPVSLLCLLAGIFSVWAQRPPPASTQPLNNAAVALRISELAMLTPKLASNFQYESESGTLLVKAGKVRFQYEPQLQFDRISPDGFWSLLAPPSRTHPKLLSSVDTGNASQRYAYNNDTVVEIGDLPDNSISCTSWTKVHNDIYSHLNTFAKLYVDGHTELRISFSPLPDLRIEVLPADYPTGRPARIAYKNAKHEFVVVEATSGEKGPFRRLGSGRLERGDPLTVFFYDGKILAAKFTFDDWSAQLSTALSTTAGWGLPQNAIEFVRSGERADSPVEIYITLAATSVGRGWETVGHSVGTYRNHVLVETTSTLSSD